MKARREISIWLAATLALVAGARAATADAPGNPYQAIVDRNVFGLKPPEAPPDPALQKPPPPKILLQGINSAFGRKQVLFKITMPPKPGDPPKELSLVMNEGERLGEVTVLEINEPAGSIKFDNHGQEQTLTLDKDAAKPPAGNPPPPIPLTGFPNPNNATAVPPVPAPPPANAAPGPPMSAAASATTLNKIPNRQLRVPTVGTGAAPATPSGTPATGLPPK